MIGILAHKPKHKEQYSGFYHSIPRKFNLKRKKLILNYLNNLRKNIQENKFNSKQTTKYSQKIIDLKN